MNFYKHHLGDYAAATSHLSWDEDCAYRRLIDQYYKREAPIPVDIKEACRLVRASTPSQRRAVEQVLREFFEPQADGWHQKRCDLELAAANAQAETNRRIAEEREARRRARIEHESSNGGANESSTNRSPATSGEREPSQTPDSTSQTPDSRNTGEAPQRRATRLPAEWALTPELLDFCRQERPDLDPAKTADRFRDYWTAKAGKDGAKLDWPATWRNWVRAEKVQIGQQQHGRQPMPTAQRDAEARRLLGFDQPQQEVFDA